MGSRQQANPNDFWKHMDTPRVQLGRPRSARNAVRRRPAMVTAHATGLLRASIWNSTCPDCDDARHAQVFHWVIFENPKRNVKDPMTNMWQPRPVRVAIRNVSATPALNALALNYDASPPHIDLGDHFSGISSSLLGNRLP